MRIHVLSDLHLEFADFAPPDVGADLVILAGDTHVGTEGVAWAAANFAGRPVIYVPGNHEYYGEAFPRHLTALRRAARGTDVHVLDRTRLDVDGIRVLGCTLWTDFGLNGDRRAAREVARTMMWDYQQIRIAPQLRPARPGDSERWHRRARAWLATELAASDRSTVVVSHHAPSGRSTPATDADHPFNPAYASDLESLMTDDRAPTLWIHGHIHHARDYVVGETRVVCNPRGYPEQTGTGFDPRLVLTV